MDYSAVITALRVRVRQIETAIAELEVLAAPNSTQAALLEDLRVSTRRRGRKSMGEAERRQVSERIKRYWADRRKRAS